MVFPHPTRVEMGIFYLVLGAMELSAEFGYTTSKSYLSKLIKAGKVSAERQENGQFRIDPSELDRLNEIRALGHMEDVSSEPEETLEETPEETGLKQERDFLKILLADRDRQIEDLRQERDAWRQQAQQLLLPAKPKWWWQR